MLSGRDADELLTGDVVLFLPGGPGLSGRSALQSSYPPVDFQATTLVTWDGSTNSERRGACGPISTSYGEAPGTMQAPSERREVYRECVDEAGGGAQEAAREMESVRQALGLEAVSVLSYSYGTEIALAFAAQFPSRVNRMVLDGPLLGSVPFSDRIRAVRSAVFRGYSGWVQSCRRRWCTGDAAALFDGSKTWAQINTVLVRRKPRVGSSNQVVTSDLLDRALLFVLTRPSVREEFAAGINSAMGGDGSELYSLSLRPFFGLDRGTYYHAMCQDVAFSSRPQAPGRSGLSGVVKAFEFDLSPCAGPWVSPAASPRTDPLSARVASRLAVVASVQDPLTPWGLVGSSSLPSGVRQCRVSTAGHTAATDSAVVTAELRFLTGGQFACPELAPRQ